MRRTLIAVLLSLSPLAGYECLQKAAEHLPVEGQVYALSLQAERETRWEHRGSGTLLQRAHHELAESARFYRLTALHLIRQSMR